VEAQDGAAQHAFQDLGAPRADAEGFPGSAMGCCQNVMMVARGSFSRIIAGSSAKW